jgi:hypothetical protein
MIPKRETEGLRSLGRRAKRYRRAESSLRDAIAHAHHRGSSYRVIAETLGEGFSRGTVGAIIKQRATWAAREQRTLDELDGKLAGLSSGAVLRAHREYDDRRARLDYVLGNGETRTSDR